MRSLIPVLEDIYIFGYLNKHFRLFKYTLSVCLSTFQWFKFEKLFDSLHIYEYWVSDFKQGMLICICRCGTIYCYQFFNQNARFSPQHYFCIFNMFCSFNIINNKFVSNLMHYITHMNVWQEFVIGKFFIPQINPSNYAYCIFCIKWARIIVWQYSCNFSFMWIIFLVEKIFDYSFFQCHTLYIVTNWNTKIKL